MKTAILMFVATACVAIAFAVPSIDPVPSVEIPAPEHHRSTPVVDAPAGEALDTGTLCADACRLVVLRDEHTFVDRGLLQLTSPAHVVEGSYRYQHEPLGRVLYVYDDAQNLVGRVVNPAQVLRFDPTH